MTENKQVNQPQENENILATFARPYRGEELRVKMDLFKGKHLVNFRAGYFKDEVWTPTQRGCTFQPEEIDSVIEALMEAKRLLQAKG